MQDGTIVRLEALIQLKNLPTYEATWEDMATTNTQFPTFHLEDKVNLWPWGNVMNPPESKVLLTYSRAKYKGKKDNS